MANRFEIPEEKFVVRMVDRPRGGAGLFTQHCALFLGGASEDVILYVTGSQLQPMVVCANTDPLVPWIQRWLAENRSGVEEFFQWTERLRATYT